MLVCALARGGFPEPAKEEDKKEEDFDAPLLPPALVGVDDEPEEIL
jgi:hypothetical protein